MGKRLYVYRRFFQANRAGERPYESYLQSSDRRVSSARSQQALSQMGLTIPELSAELVLRYLDFYQTAGLLKRSN